MRCLPSTDVVSFDRARRLSLPRDLARFFSNRRNASGPRRVSQTWCTLVSSSRVVPEVEVSPRRVADHRAAVGTRRSLHDPGPGLAIELAGACRDLEACEETLDVPLPRPGERLVEVVEVEHDHPVRGCEPAEVRQVRVAAALHPDARARRRGQVRGHHRRRAAIERERGRGHPGVPDRDQLLHAARRLLLQDRHRAPAIGRGLPRPVAAPRRRGARLPTARRARPA